MLRLHRPLPAATVVNDPMNDTLLAIDPARHELAALRQAIKHLAVRCGIDIADRASIRALLAGDLAALPDADSPNYIELRTMLSLLYRLEDSTSEDIGIDGLQRLWRQHGEIIDAHTRRNA